MSLANRYRPIAKPAEKPAPRKAKNSISASAPQRPGKEAISIRLDADVLASYRSLGKGWQSRLNDDLRKARGL